MAAFTDKGRFSAMMKQIPVHVVLNERLGLLGAARHALCGLGDLPAQPDSPLTRQPERATNSPTIAP